MVVVKEREAVLEGCKLVVEVQVLVLEKRDVVV